MSMNELVYLIGQISARKPETHKWRERILTRYSGDPRVDFIDPCSNSFNQEIMKMDKEKVSYTEMFKNIKGTQLLVPKDKSYVTRSTMAIANMNTYDSKKPIIGTFFELAWYIEYPEKTVIGIYGGDREKDLNCNHPFVKEAVNLWVKDDAEACAVLDHYYLKPLTHTHTLYRGGH